MYTGVFEWSEYFNTRYQVLVPYSAVPYQVVCSFFSSFVALLNLWFGPLKYSHLQGVRFELFLRFRVNLGHRYLDFSLASQSENVRNSAI